jgi:hypothetical protein
LVSSTDAAKAAIFFDQGSSGMLALWKDVTEPRLNGNERRRESGPLDIVNDLHRSLSDENTEIGDYRTVSGAS